MRKIETRNQSRVIIKKNELNEILLVLCGKKLILFDIKSQADEFIHCGFEFAIQNIQPIGFTIICIAETLYFCALIEQKQKVR